MKKVIIIILSVMIIAILFYVFTIYFPFQKDPQKIIQDKPDSKEIISDIKFKTETLAEGLESPWAIRELPDGRILILERPGKIKIFDNGKITGELSGVPETEYRSGSQGGLLDIELHPDFKNNGLVYLSYVIKDGGNEMTRVSRFKLDGDKLTFDKIIFPGFPGSKKAKHFGNRIRFGTDAKLYITLGERGEGERAQNLLDLNGKTLRLNEDGTVPEDNPFYGRADALWEIFSYGNRNSQGMAIQPGTGLVFQTEHGPSGGDGPGGGDEVNIIESGKNYGWNVISHKESKAGMVSPLLEYTPAIAPSGMMFYTGDKFPQWKGNLFFTNLVGRCLIRVELDGRNVKGEEVLLKREFGRLRDVMTGSDGYIYFITSDTDEYGPGRDKGDRLVRIVPE
ncbi:MAG: PQQ-dependent sugar dehydrogenase [Ignavibacteria bacterium]|nr:PQQ-dependent sugar dehydrogenase [Ignavibacteria bacterium]